MDKLMQEIGEKITRTRKKIGMSQEELAFMAGLSRKTMHNIENGKTRVHVITIQKIIGVLNLSLEDFFSGFCEIEEDIYEQEENK